MNCLTAWHRIISLGLLGSSLLLAPASSYAESANTEAETNPWLACLKAEGEAEALTDYYGANSASGNAWFVAARICSRQLEAENAALYKQLTRRCDRAYQDRQGTMFIAFHGSCYFSAYEYVSALNAGAEFGEDSR